MTDEAVVKPGPVDNTQRDPSYAAQAAQQAPKEAPEQDVTEQTEEAEVGEQNESEQTAATETDGAQPQKPQKGVGKRIDELTKNWRDAERDRDHWREQALRAQQAKPEQPQQAVQPATNDADPEPTMADADWDVSDYNRKWYAWQRRQEKREEQQAKDAQERQSRAQKFQESAQAFAQANPDFQSVISNPNLPVNELMVEVISESDNPAAVAYWLGKNVDEARKIAGMSPAAMGRAIAKIESQFDRVEPEQREPVQKTVTNAPPPPSALNGSKVAVKKLEEMSMTEYAAHRAAERQAKGLRP